MMMTLSTVDKLVVSIT